MKALKVFLLKIVDPIFDRMGVELRPRWKATSLKNGLRRLKSRGAEVATIIDVGASYGKWVEEVSPFLPNVDWLLIEAQSIHEASLVELCATNPRCQYVLAAAGNRPGELFFDASDPLGGVASHDEIAAEKVVRVPMTTLDIAVEQKKLAGPFLLKLDTHGFEVPIFEGAQNVLSKTNIIIVECYNFKLSDQCLKFEEMCSYLAGFGFRCVDMIEPLYRQDGVLWQFDLIFERNEARVFSQNSYTGALGE